MKPGHLVLLLFGALLLPLRALAAPSADADEQRVARELLDELLRVDTSRGDETRALQPIAARLKLAGIPVEIVESSPGRGNLVARLKGTGKKKPLLILAHIDVVPTAGQPWTSSPYQPVEKDGYLQARGVGDDKSMAAAIVAVALRLKQEKLRLGRDLIVALTAGEETGGAAGVRWLVDHRRDLIDAELVLNEGGPILLSNDEKKVQLVSIGSAEKSYQSYTLTVHGKGGHSSMPSEKDDPVLRLARALVRVGELRLPMRVLPSVKDYLRVRAGWEAAPIAEALRRVVASAPVVAAADEAVLAAEPTINASLRTTCVTTMLEASPADNVLPTQARATVNCRILPDETREAVGQTLARAIGDAAVEVRPIEDIGVAPGSPLDGPVPAAITAVARKLWPGTEVVHMLGAGATDSRHLRAIGMAAYGISTAPMSLAEALKGRAAHGPDERRPVRWLGEGVRFLDGVVRELVR